MSYSVLLTPEAEQDLERLLEFVLERELERNAGNFELAQEALEAITSGLKALERFPFTCRKAGSNPFLRERVIPFGATGCVAFFEIVDSETIIVAAVRHQREDDYH
jgi:plasmid stabilization system protein ParE